MLLKMKKGSEDLLLFYVYEYLTADLLLTSDAEKAKCIYRLTTVVFKIILSITLEKYRTLIKIKINHTLKSGW